MAVPAGIDGMKGLARAKVRMDAPTRLSGTRGLLDPFIQSQRSTEALMVKPLVPKGARRS